MESEILNLIYNHYDESQKDTPRVKMADKDFYEYLDNKMSIDEVEREFLSTKKNAYGAECKRQGFYDGFQYAIRIVGEISKMY